MKRVVVIGAGVTGLAAAYRLKDHADVTVLEASDRIGGKALGTEFAGRPIVDAGADMFLSRVPWALDLCAELGIDGDLVSPATSKAYVWWNDRLHDIPSGLMLGVPTGISGLARSGLLSTRGKVRAAVEPLLPRRDSADCVGQLIRSRFGNEVAERLVDPLLGGINAGDCDRLSLAASAPQIAAATSARSLLLALRRQQPKTPTGPAFFAPRGGIATIPVALADRLTDVRLSTPVLALERDGAQIRVVFADGQITADHVILTVPAFAAAPLLKPIAPESEQVLATIPFASVAMVTLDVRRTDLTCPLDGAGVLVPKPVQRELTAVSFASIKWPHLARDGSVLLRASLGRIGNDAVVAQTDDELLATTLAELERVIGYRGSPDAVRIVRWERSFPQYTPGHLTRVAEIRRSLATAAPGVTVAGASFDGIGIPACVRQGNEAARAITS